MKILVILLALLSPLHIALAEPPLQNDPDSEMCSIPVVQQLLDHHDAVHSCALAPAQCDTLSICSNTLASLLGIEYLYDGCQLILDEVYEALSLLPGCIDPNNTPAAVNENMILDNRFEGSDTPSNR